MKQPDHKPTPLWQKLFLAALFLGGGLSFCSEHKGTQAPQPRATDPIAEAASAASAAQASMEATYELRVARACQDAIAKKARHPKTVDFSAMYSSFAHDNEAWIYKDRFEASNDYGVADDYDAECWVVVTPTADANHPNTKIVKLRVRKASQ